MAAGPRAWRDEEWAAVGGTYAAVLASDAQRRLSEFCSRLAAAQRALSEIPYPEAHVRWAASIVASRAFTLAARARAGAPPHALSGVPFLAPGADMLNHSPAARVGWVLGRAGTGAGAFEVLPLAPVVAGAEVFNHYRVRSCAGGPASCVGFARNALAHAARAGVFQLAAASHVRIRPAREPR